ncbi:MAG: hypothetical protein ABIJ59_04860 [Pseudomonadota bacterium]
MKKHYLITGLLAVVFCITGHFFMAAYTDFCINQSRLELLRSQERSVKYQIAAYQEKLNQLEQVNAFVRQTSRLGLKKKQWDNFFVNLKDEPLSYSKLGVILGQTQNSRHYFFKPGRLSIKTGTAAKTGTADPETPAAQSSSDTISQLKETAQPSLLKGTASSETDVTISLDGRFLVRRQGAG